MSGHSKWSKIKRQKGVADAKRGNIFTKLGKAITLAARQGGGDPEMNFKLRLAINKAKQANMPKDNIERAIKRGTGELAGQNIEEVIYEGFGPEKIGLIIEAVTDNKNRTVSELKHIFSKFGGSLASNGSVMWMFEQKGIIYCELRSSLTEEQELKLIDLGVEDWKSDQQTLIIYTPVSQLQTINEKIKELNLTITSSEITYLPKEMKTISNPDVWQKFIEALEENDDVNNYYSNASS